MYTFIWSQCATETKLLGRVYHTYLVASAIPQKASITKCVYYIHIDFV